MLVSFAREGSWTTQTLPSAYTLANYVRLFNEPFASEVFLNSVSMAAIAAVAALLWSFCVVTLLVRRGRGRLIDKSWRRLLSLLVLIPWALPGTVVAVSVAEAYGRPGSLLGSFVLVGTFWILPVVYFLRFMPLVVRALQASMEQLDPALDEAAGSPGARAWQRFTRVTLPLVWPGAVAGTLLAFVIALGEYGVGAGVCPGEPSHLHCHRIRAARLQSRRGGGIRRCADCDHLSQHGGRGQTGKNPWVIRQMTKVFKFRLFVSALLVWLACSPRGEIKRANRADRKA